MCAGLEVAAIGASELSARGALYSGQQQKKMANYQTAQAERGCRCGTGLG